jgi:serine/threonine protein kinase
MSFLPDSTLDHLRRLTDVPDFAGFRYRIEEEIGRGGMGIVYRAWDTQLDRRVALKIIDTGPIEEARIAAQLEHPGLVPIYDAGILPDGRGYYAMRLVHGSRLDQFLRQEPSLPSRLRVFEKVCEAVAFAHDRGVIHCDLKPQNIMAGSFGEVFVMDWGIARLARQEGATVAVGTPPYMAPEQNGGIPGPAADIFALGRILQDLATSPCPRPLAAIIRKATAPAVADRYASVSELSRDVIRFLDGFPVAAHPENPWEQAARFVRRNQVLLLLLAAFLAAKLALFFARR